MTVLGAGRPHLRDALPPTLEMALQIVGKEASREKLERSPDSVGFHVHVVSEARGRKAGRPECRAAACSPWLRWGCPRLVAQPCPSVAWRQTRCPRLRDAAIWQLSLFVCQLRSHVALLTAGPGPSRGAHSGHPGVLSSVPGPTHSMPGAPPAVMTSDVPTHGTWPGVPQGQNYPRRGQRKGARSPCTRGRGTRTGMSLSLQGCEHLAVGAPDLLTQKLKNKSSRGSILKL